MQKKLVYNLLNFVFRFAYWRWAGFLAINFNRRTELEYSENLLTKTEPHLLPIRCYRMAFFSFLFANYFTILFIAFFPINDFSSLKISALFIFCQCCSKVGSNRSKNPSFATYIISLSLSQIPKISDFISLA